FVGHTCPPLRSRFQHDRGVIHVQGSVVCCTVGPPHRAENCFHLRTCPNDPVLLLQQGSGLRNRNARKCGWHIQGCSLEQRRHELATDTQHKRNGERKK